MQYAHFELQPIETCTQAWKRRSRCIGSVPAKLRSSPIPNEPRATLSPPAPSHSPRCGIVPGPEGDVDEGIQVEEALALGLRVAAADGDHRVGAALLERAGLGEVGGEALVGLLADRAGVEDEDVRLLLRRPPPPGRAPRACP